MLNNIFWELQKHVFYTDSPVCVLEKTKCAISWFNKVISTWRHNIKITMFLSFWRTVSLIVKAILNIDVAFYTSENVSTW